MADLEAYYRVFLENTFVSRKKRNPQYSLRAFGRALGLDSGFISRLLAGKLLLSLDAAESIAKKLGMPADVRKQFLLSVAEEQKCHALYMIDPSCTECLPALDATNRLPLSKKSKK